MSSVFANERLRVKTFNALNVTDIDAQGNTRTGIDNTARDITTKLSAIKGYLLHNTDKFDIFVCLYYGPASDVTLGVTVPDYSVRVKDGESTGLMFDQSIISERGFSVTGAYSEDFSFGVAVLHAITGMFFYSEQGVI